ncbi:PrgI family protein [Alkalihalobacillus sp. LMS39]|uniref:PrgI family protein n=1 Tax=Alkalihalobacillus sp. LMS39 TaxID=2924032 RepID=UPI001FB2E82C|nr:PrgI family protein [Alkalihalobacillus sp. LMS39]UOE94776.1 PrgI family protein [Alkalihalobacillus sp. LMS39]
MSNNNNYVIPIPKDLKKIQAKLFFGLTQRQLIGFGVAVISGTATFLALKPISIDAGMYGLFFSGAPIFFATIYQRDGMYTEQWIKLIIEHKYLNPSRRYFRVSKRNLPLAKERKVVQRAKKRRKSQTRKLKQTKATKPVSSSTTTDRQKTEKTNVNTRNT